MPIQRPVPGQTDFGMARSGHTRTTIDRAVPPFISTFHGRHDGQGRYGSGDVDMPIARQTNQPGFLRRDSLENDRAIVRSRRYARSTSPVPEGPWTVARERDRGRRSLAPVSPPLPPIRPGYREGAGRKERSRSASPVRGPAFLKEVQAVLSPHSTLDTTISLELDIEEDLEGQLEEFSRLKRLGHFKAAEQYFQSNLRDYVDLPPVAVEYAEMLLRQGAYKHLKELLLKKQLTQPSRDGSTDYVRDARLMSDSQSLRDNNSFVRAREVEDMRADAERFDLAFRLIEVSADMFSQGWLRRALADARTSEMELDRHRRRQGRLRSSRLASTEVQIISHWLYITSYVEDSSSFMEESEIVDVWSDWSGLYQSLLAEGRIWEARDIILASLDAFGTRKTWQNLFHANVHSADFFSKFLDDWKMDEYDEATYLAALDILGVVGANLASRTISSDRDVIATAKRCVGYARDISIRIRENNPENLKSRPYVQWILAQEVLARKLEDLENETVSNKRIFSAQHLANFPGLAVWMSVLPIYVPVKSENPGWPVSDLPVESSELLQIALKASRELGDYQSEASCLKELICRSIEPEALFRQLAHLQKSVQGDNIGYLQTCLSRYLCTTDDESRQTLSDELAAFDARQPISYDIRNPLMKWCQRMVQSALHSSLGRSQVEAFHAQEMAKSLVVDLPDNVRSQIRIFDSNDYIDVRRGPTSNRDSRRNIAYNSRLSSDNARQEQSRKIWEELDVLQRKRDELTERERDLHRHEGKMRRELDVESTEVQKKLEAGEKRLQMRLKKALEESGMDKDKIAAILETLGAPYPVIPTYTRVPLRLISTETLDKFQIDYELEPVRPRVNSSKSKTDPNKEYPDYVLIKRWVPSPEQDFLMRQTNSHLGSRRRASVSPDNESWAQTIKRTPVKGFKPTTDPVTKPHSHDYEPPDRAETGLTDKESGRRSKIVPGSPSLRAEYEDGEQETQEGVAAVRNDDLTSSSDDSEHQAEEGDPGPTDHQARMDDAGAEHASSSDKVDHQADEADPALEGLTRSKI
ncbi:MAG: hypothetical protein M1818_005015 [Claussenomyces sp. TS43310]|nr:MAG: hypothetical protein M1818_005015 [Claussenomyces sp. TS43310]